MRHAAGGSPAAHRVDLGAARWTDSSEIDVVVRQRLAAGEDLYRLDRDALAELDPTMIVTQDLCAVCAVDVTEVDDALTYLGCRAEVVTLDPSTLDEVFDSVLTLGRATGTEAAAATVVADCRSRLAAVERLGCRCVGSPDAGVGVDRSGVHRRSLGARPRHGGGRPTGPRPSRCRLGQCRLAGGHVLWSRSRARRTMRLPPRRRRRARLSDRR